MKTVKGFDVRPLTPRGEIMPDVDVIVKVGRKEWKARTASKSGVASFPLQGDLKHGAKFDIEIGGKVVFTETVPSEFEMSYPVLEFKVGVAEEKKDEAPHDGGHAKHADHKKEPALVVSIVDGKTGKELFGAVIHVKEYPQEAYRYEKDANDIEIEDAFAKPVTFVVTALGYETREVKVSPREKTMVIELDADTKDAVDISWKKVFLYGLTFLGIVLLAWFMYRSGTLRQGFSLVNRLSDPVVASLMLASVLVAGPVAILGRLRLGQFSDIGGSAAFLALAGLSGLLSGLDTIDPQIMAILPAQAVKNIEWLVDFRQIIWWIGFAVMYATALANTPDLTMPGFIWDIASYVVYTTGFRMGLGFTSVDDFTLAIALKGFAGLHYVADIFQPIQFLLKREANQNMAAVVFGVLTILTYVAVSFAIPHAWALAAVGIAAGLLAEMSEEVTKKADPAQMGNIARVFLEFTKTNKADGVLLAAVIIVVAAWFGVY